MQTLFLLNWYNMNENLRVLDKFDKEKNIYEMIVKWVKMCSVISQNSPSVSETADSNILHLVMEKLLHEKIDE